MCGMCYGPKKRHKLAKNSGFLVFFFNHHSTHNLLICQLQVYFSQGHSPAYLRLFLGTIEGLWGPLKVKKRPKMGQKCKF